MSITPQFSTESSAQSPAHLATHLTTLLEYPRLVLAYQPTPIHTTLGLVHQLKKSAARVPEIIIKRDDLTGLAFGGNKTRKLEFLLADAQKKNADTLITAGAIQSNHCRQTAAAAAKMGKNCVLVLNGTQPEEASANYMLDQLFGARVIFIAEKEQRDIILQETFDQARQEGKNPYLVPYGGSNDLGALAYARALHEILGQDIATGQVKPTHIVVGSSSGGTQAGLVLGARLCGYQGNIIGISIDESAADLKNKVAQLASEASQLLGKSGEPLLFSDDDIQVTDAYCKSGYGCMTEAEQKAIQLLARTEGILLDPVYTGRAAAGLLDLVHKGAFQEIDKVLFLHTGGQPALFASQYQSEVLKQNQ